MTDEQTPDEVVEPGIADPNEGETDVEVLVPEDEADDAPDEGEEDEA